MLDLLTDEVNCGLLGIINYLTRQDDVKVWLNINGMQCAVHKDSKITIDYIKKRR